MNDVKPTNKTNRIEIANKNIAICKKGRYTIHKLVPIRVSLADTIVDMLTGSVYISEKELHKKRLNKYLSESVVDSLKKVEVRDENVVDTIHTLGKNNKVAVLNFASAKHPGGGYLYGAMAQEEALCYSSTLYTALERHKLKKEYYFDNEATGNALYTDGIIYTPSVSFFRDADFNLLEKPTVVDVITCPAPNRSALKNDDFLVSNINNVLYRRMSYIIDTCVGKADTLILGAFGCGVFGNSAMDVACIWKKILLNDGYITKFNKIVFSIYRDQDKLNKFKEVWER